MLSSLLEERAPKAYEILLLVGLTKGLWLAQPYAGPPSQPLLALGSVILVTPSKAQAYTGRLTDALPGHEPEGLQQSLGEGKA